MGLSTPQQQEDDEQACQSLLQDSATAVPAVAQLQAKDMELSSAAVDV